MTAPTLLAPFLKTYSCEAPTLPRIYPLSLQDGTTHIVLTIEVEAEHIQAIRLIANPEKLARI